MSAHVCEVTSNGLLVPADPTAWTLALYKLSGRKITVDLEVYRYSRSGQQNRYFHGVVLPILGDHLGYTKNEMRNALALKFLSTADEKTGLVRIRGTSDLSTVEFEDFMAEVRQWAGEFLHVSIPLPGEYDINEVRTSAKEAA